MLNTLIHPARTPSGAVPLIIVHGLFGLGRNFNSIARTLSDMRDVIAVDQRNHGDSFWSDTHDYPSMAQDVAEVIAAHGGQADVLGHSMGGKTAMHLALTQPDLVRRLVVADIAPVVYGHDQMAHLRTMRDLDLTGIKTRRDADARMAKVQPDAGLRAFFLQSLDLKSDPPRWKINLATMEREMPKVMDWPGAPGPFDGPTLFLSGGTSDYVRAEHRAPIRALFPRARFAKLPQAGHWLHADAPREFEATVKVFLEA
ncbi:alpha/beta fold hydrolase [Falsirhodobacter halotolerans]|uniref:alpha/beta fold hydrolase n=1 Tax=Falsirhodobacter halotolerans TaxID=1146892 RepID=UPI001FD4566E|nr:alpha/beta fold hydrolase [Falsirhodobacter halotolerans]MCJ8138894.1 alpha/beta fold hydrolase [Falsirhodobacter halotolerans]